MFDEFHIASESDDRIQCGAVRNSISAIDLFTKKTSRLLIRCRRVFKQLRQYFWVHFCQNNGRPSFRASLGARHGPLLLGRHSVTRTGQQYWLGANSGAPQYDRQMDRLDRLVG